MATGGRSSAAGWTVFAVGGWRQSQRAIETLAQRIPVTGVPQRPPDGTPLAL